MDSTGFVSAITALTDQLKVCTDANGSLTSENKSLNDRVKTLESKLETLREQYQTLQTEHASAMTKANNSVRSFTHRELESYKDKIARETIEDSISWVHKNLSVRNDA